MPHLFLHHSPLSEENNYNLFININLIKYLMNYGGDGVLWSCGVYSEGLTLSRKELRISSNGGNLLFYYLSNFLCVISQIFFNDVKCLLCFTLNLFSWNRKLVDWFCHKVENLFLLFFTMNCATFHRLCIEHSIKSRVNKQKDEL